MRPLSILAILVFTFALGAQAADPGVTVLSSSVDRTVLQFDVSDFELTNVSVDGQPYALIRWEDGVTSQVRGEPALPGFHTSIVIPDDAEMALTVVDAAFTDYPNVRIAPSKGVITRDVLPQTVPYAFSDSYQRDAFHPADIAGLVEPYILRDVRGIVVAVNPFRWNPVTETLRVYTRIVVDVEAVGPGKINVLTRRPEKLAQEFRQIYDRHFVNYGMTHRYSTVGETGKLLVVAHDAFLSAVQPLVDWRNQMGVETELVPMSMVGSSANDLDSYCQGRYDNDGVCFILLVGDGAQIPYLTSGGGAADPMLTLCAGGDSYPDAFVGRISASTVAQVTTQVERIIEYERDPQPAGAWYAKAVAIASNEGEGYGDDGEADWEHARNYRSDLLGFTYSRVDELYDGSHPAPPPGEGAGADASGNPSSGDLVNLVNEGRSLIHYTGHGSTTAWASTGFDIQDINGLTNDNMLPMVVSVGCVNGAFESTTCFAEAWLRATNGSEPTGAVAAYASTVNQQWATPMRAQDEMIDLLTTNEKRTWGGICFNGSCDMIDHYGSNGISEFKNWTIFGDPTIRVRTGRPTNVAANHGGSVDPLGDEFAVQTAPGALAALSHDGVFIGSAFADGSGSALVPYDAADLAGLTTVTLTVTAFNGIPHVEDTPVGAVVGVADASEALSVRPNKPNPFRSSTSISFGLATPSTASLDIFDANGRRVRAIRTASLPAGSHAFAWDATDDQGRPVGAGTYFYRLTAGANVVTQRMVVLR